MSSPYSSACHVPNNSGTAVSSTWTSRLRLRQRVIASLRAMRATHAAPLLPAR